MDTRNHELILLTGKMLYQLQQHKQYGDGNSLKLAYLYKQRAEAMLHKIEGTTPAAGNAKLYINR